MIVIWKTVYKWSATTSKKAFALSKQNHNISTISLYDQNLKDKKTKQPEINKDTKELKNKMY